MRSLLVGLCLWAWCAGADPAQQEYRRRRDELVKALPDTVVVLFGRSAAEAGGRAAFWQEPNFYYLTGWNEPGAALLLSGRAQVLLLPKPDARTLLFEGPRLSPDDPRAPELTGFETVLPLTRLEEELGRALAHNAKLATITSRPEAEKLRALAPLRPLNDVRPALARLRARKSAQELDRIQRSIDVTIQAHRAAWKRLAPGLYEYQIAATLVGGFLEGGCEGPAYAPIVASGPNGLILHYEKNARRLEPGELLLVDAGAACGGYAADLTRTVPVSGRFSPRQRELYAAVLGALKAVIAAVRPGMLVGSRDNVTGLYKIARDYLDAHGKDPAGRPLGERFVHGIGHRVGLEVHDVYNETLNLPLEPGDVLAIEPGVYIQEENLGIRIEDMVLVTENGARLLSAALPREIEEIEKEISGGGSSTLR